MNIQIIPTMGPRVCRSCLHWAILGPYTLSPKHAVVGSVTCMEPCSERLEKQGFSFGGLGFKVLSFRVSGLAVRV